MNRPKPEVPNVNERGREGTESDRRLFMQFHAFTDCENPRDALGRMEEAKIRGAVYVDAVDSRGIGIVSYSEDPAWFVGAFRDLLNGPIFRSLTRRPDFSMFGRTYTLGYEDLEEALFNRPIRHLMHGEWPWCIWYPLRRKGAFTQLPHEEQREILMEHGVIGHGYGNADLAHDIRLAAHGLDANDNDFVIGLMAKDLAPLSKLVERMRRTKQTSTWIEKLGPFFVGRKIGQVE